MENKRLLKTLAVVFGIAGSLLAVLAIAVFEGYITPVDVDNFSDGMLGTLSALSIVAAAGCAVGADKE